MAKKLTHEEFVKRAKEINPTLKITSKYVNSKTNIDCECLECGTKISIQPSYIMSNGGHICKNKIKSSKQCKTHNTFINELREVNSNIDVIGTYTKAIEKIKCRCKICNHIWNPIAYSILQGQGCPKCGKQRQAAKRRKPYDVFVNELSKINNDITVIGQYVNTSTKIECCCKICGTTWFPRPNALLRGCGCPKCAIQKNTDNLRKTHEQYVNDLIENNICLRPIEQYKKSSVPILHECLNCGSKRKYMPNDVLRRKYCPVCQGNDLIVEYGVNSLCDTNPEIVDMLSNKELGKIYSYKSTKKVDFICPNCNSLVKNKQIQYVVKHGLPCQKCSDGISYPMKFIMCLLNQIGVEYNTEMVFDGWSFNFDGYEYKPRYDIVIGKNIIEVDGETHIKEHSHSKTSIRDIQCIDNNKDKLAEEHGYNMIRIKCYQSDMDYIRNSVLESNLAKIFDLSNIDWIECHKYAISSKIKEVCDYWNKLENPSVTRVFTDLKMPRITVQRWLKKGTLAGMCDYNSYEEGKKYREKIYKNNRKSVICLSTNKIYDSLTNAEKETGINASSISNNCSGKSLYAGKNENSEKLYWMYYSDYLKGSGVV